MVPLWPFIWTLNKKQAQSMTRVTVPALLLHLQNRSILGAFSKPSSPPGRETSALDRAPTSRDRDHWVPSLGGWSYPASHMLCDPLDQGSSTWRAGGCESRVSLCSAGLLLLRQNSRLFQGRQDSLCLWFQYIMVKGAVWGLTILQIGSSRKIGGTKARDSPPRTCPK